MSNEEESEWMQNTSSILEQLKGVLQGKKQLLILTHNHPDPDAIAGAAALKLLVQEITETEASIAYSGIIARAENRRMIKLLDISMKQYNRIKLSKYDCVAMVDSQPGAGNNVLNADSPCDIVIDHHPLRKDTKAPFILVQPDVGASATLLIHLLDGAGIAVSADLATALSYAISSETQNMFREAERVDIKAYLSVYVRASIRKLADIINAKLPHHYFIQLGNAINNAQVHRNLITSHLEKIVHPEIVAEMADFLLKHDRITLVLTTGYYEDQLIMSIRSSSPKQNAGTLIKKLPLNPDNVGGHETTAGGFVDLSGMDREKQDVLVRELQESFGSLLGYPNAVWKPLL
jgi:nanoRNase/pAp phosphatase (c-di-AMP/oligoRNAs hydrolase)